MIEWFEVGSLVDHLPPEDLFVLVESLLLSVIKNKALGLGRFVEKLLCFLSSRRGLFWSRWMWWCWLHCRLQSCGFGQSCGHPGFPKGEERLGGDLGGGGVT